jgi:hypothetical protein
MSRVGILAVGVGLAGCHLALPYEHAATPPDGGEVQVAWPCATAGWTNSDESPLGVVTHSECYRVGDEGAGWAAHWISHPTNTTLEGAACCR